MAVERLVSKLDTETDKDELARLVKRIRLVEFKGPINSSPEVAMAVERAESRLETM